MTRLTLPTRAAVALLLAVGAAATRLVAQQLVPGANINMVKAPNDPNYEVEQAAATDDARALLKSWGA